MSNEIQPGKLTTNLTSSESQKTDKLAATRPEAKSSGSEQTKSAVTVSMTDDVSRLQEIEGMLKNMPTVNSALVSAISQQLADGSLEINLDRIAASLLEAEGGISDPSK